MSDVPAVTLRICAVDVIDHRQLGVPVFGAILPLMIVNVARRNAVLWFDDDTAIRRSGRKDPWNAYDQCQS